MVLLVSKKKHDNTASNFGLTQKHRGLPRAETSSVVTFACAISMADISKSFFCTTVKCATLASGLVLGRRSQNPCCGPEKEFLLSEVIKCEWFDLNTDTRDQTWRWLHENYLPAVQSAQGIGWVGHYKIVELPNRPYIEGAPQKKTTQDPTVGTGWQNVILTAALSPDVFFGPGSAIDALKQQHASALSKFQNYRSAVFIEEQVTNSPEHHAHPYGMGPPPAMQIGNYNTDTPEDEIELAQWYRAERFPRVAVTPGMIRGRKLLSIAGWPKHGVLWEFADMPEGDHSFEHRFIAADRNENWQGRHVLEYVTHSYGGPHAGRRVWPPVG